MIKEALRESAGFEVSEAYLRAYFDHDTCALHNFIELAVVRGSGRKQE